MSSITATRQRRFWLTTSFLIPIVSLGISGAQAQQPPSEPLPPIEVTSPTDPNRTRAKPTYDEASTSRRVVPAAAPSTGTRPAAGTGSDVARKAPRKVRAEAPAGSSPASSARRRPLLPPKR